MESKTQGEQKHIEDDGEQRDIPGSEAKEERKSNDTSITIRELFPSTENNLPPKGWVLMNCSYQDFKKKEMN